MLAPGACSAWASRSDGDEGRRGRFVGQHDDLARAGDAVDGHLAEDAPLGQGHEQVARPDDHVHGRHSFDAVSQRRHRLGAADAVDLGDAEFMADGQQVAVVGAGRRRRHDDGQLRHAGRPRRDRRSSAALKGTPPPRRESSRRRAAAADSARAVRASRETVITASRCSRPAWNDQHVFPHAAHRFQKGGVGGGVGQRHFRSGNAQSLGVEADAVELFGVVEEGGRRRGRARPHRRARQRAPAAEASPKTFSVSSRPRAETMLPWR